MLSIFALSILLAAPFPDQGISAQYPGDREIDKDARVVFVENFEGPSLDEIWKRWETVGDKPGQSLTADIPPGSSGNASLLMDRTKGPGPQLFRRIKNKTGAWGYDRLFARYYVKFDPDCGEIHHFGTCLGGNNPPTPWPSVRAGPLHEARSVTSLRKSGQLWTGQISPPFSRPDRPPRRHPGPPVAKLNLYARSSHFNYEL